MANKPELDFKLDTDYPVSLLFDSPINGTNNFGEWNMYTVKYGGDEFVFFAADDCHEQLNQYKKDAHVNIKKVYNDNEGKTKYEVTPLGGVQDTTTNGAEKVTDTQTNGAKSPVSGGFTPGVRDKSTNTSIETQVKWKEIAPIMSVALQAGIDITEPLPEGFLNNINSIYLTLQNADLPF